MKLGLRTPLRRRLALLCFQLQIWDTAGQERFRSITQSYYRSAHAIVLGEAARSISFSPSLSPSLSLPLSHRFFSTAMGVLLSVYDVACQPSFDCLPEWLGEIEQYANRKVLKILVGAMRVIFA